MDWDESIATAEQSGDADYWNARGRELADAGDFAGSVHCFRRAEALGSSVALFNIGNAFAEQQRWEEAAHAYLRATELGDSQAWRMYGLVLYANHSMKNAGIGSAPIGLLTAYCEGYRFCPAWTFHAIPFA
jgi:tetratricopeptide (TPR) repeat protein